jgi:hypothetical protein
MFTNMTVEEVKLIGIIPTKFENYVMSVPNGFSDKLPCFWSCREGRNKAKEYKECCTDDECPIIKSLFDYCKSTGRHDEYMTELSYAISRLYALNIKNIKKDNKIIHVFMGSDKKSEITGFHVGNNFWKAELPILQNLLCENIINDIILHVYDYEGNHIRDYSIKNDDIDLPLWRRNWHILDDISTKNSYVDGITTQEGWDKWRTYPSRPYITYSKMKDIIMRWKSKTDG